MLSKTMESAINEQLNKEMFSAYLYMAMSAYADENGLKGIAHWFMVQYHEEMVHAMKFYEYLQDQGNKVSLGAIEKPTGSFSSALTLFQAALAHEQFITKSINDLMELALKEKDHATKTFLEWYVTEQVEEEKNANDIIQILKMIGDNTAALYLYDKELSARTVNVPTNFTMGISAAMGGA
ncbi:MAG: ferritin [Chitinispirillaceae bacterium]|nr:ferritin [Chitinispirillaceae bacterium]